MFVSQLDTVMGLMFVDCCNVIGSNYCSEIYAWLRSDATGTGVHAYVLFACVFLGSPYIVRSYECLYFLTNCVVFKFFFFHEYLLDLHLRSDLPALYVCFSCLFMVSLYFISYFSIARERN